MPADGPGEIREGSRGSAPVPLDFEPFLTQARSYLGRFYRLPQSIEDGDLRGEFASGHGRPPDLYGAADAAYVLWILDELSDRTKPEGRLAWAERIQSYQNAESGWFDRSLLPGHGVAHATALATGALLLLDARPARPLRYANELFASRASIDAWLDRLRWSQIWSGSHAVGAAAAAIDAPEGLSLPRDWGSSLLDALSDRVDPATGFWKRAFHDRMFRRPTTLDLGGAAHFWWLFDRLGRPIPHPERVLDGILGLQRRSGLWGSRIFGGAFPHCIDFDALHGLQVAWQGAGEDFREARRGPLRAALARYARAAHAMLTPPSAVDRLYRTPHKLMGALNTLAELDAVSEEVFQQRRTVTRRPLRPTLTRTSWQ